MKKLITLLFICLIQTSFATTYYVSNSGNDANTGTTISTPWQTLAKVNSTTFNPGDNILFRKGDTFYGKMTISNSGSSGNPITFGSYGSGANPVITGFTNVSLWTDLGGDIWQSTNTVSNLANCNVVLSGGINTAMGRTPNAGFWTYSSFTGTSISSSSLDASTINWTGAQTVIKKERYVLEKYTITSASGSTINYSSSSPYSGHSNWGFFIQNDMRTLDQQNEWYYNPSTKKLSIYSTNEPTNVKLATKDTLVYAVNKSYITFNEITFTGANEQSFYLGNVKNFNVQNCNFDYNYNAILGKQFGGSSSDLVINDCTFNHSNNNAIELPPEFAGATVTNNLIKRTGLLEGMAGSGQSRWGISTSGNDYLIQNNEVDSTGYVAIGFNGSSVLCENNFVNYYCLITDDGGGIYNGNPQSGVVISNNIILNGIGNGEGTNGSNHGRASGIYCDDNSSGMQILNNSIANAGFSSIFLHNSKDIEVRGNTTFNSQIGLLVDRDNTDEHTTGLIIKGNILVGNNTGARYSPDDQQSIWFRTKYTSGDDITTFGTVDSNYYARPIDDVNTIQGTVYTILDTYYTLSSWQSYTGYDLHSHKSPKAVTSPDSLIFVYNNTNADSTVLLPYNYIDMASNSYDGSITIQPYSSAVLIQDGEATTGLTENKNATPISIFPNPVNNHFTVEGATQISSIKVIDLSGRTMKTFKPTSSNTYSISGLASGTYLVVITDGNSEVSKHIVKQ